MRHDFKGRHFEGEVILWAVRWYRRHGVPATDFATEPDCTSIRGQFPKTDRPKVDIHLPSRLQQR
jgi:hypothetical protein